SVEPATLALFDRLGREESAVRILHHPGPFNYPALNNAAAKEAKGEVLLLLNNDIKVIEPDWLRELVSQTLRPEVGVAGAKLLYANGRLQHGGIVLGPEGQITHVHRLADRNQPGYFGQLALARTLSAVTAACAAMRRSVFFEVGGLDEVNLPVAFNDVDLCLRVANHGYRVVWTPFAELFHLESASRGPDGADSATRTRFLRELQYMHQTWGGLLESADPFHNPNLRFAWEYFQVPSPPRREKPWRPFFLEAFALKRHFSPSQGISG
ncbi:MAG TPA: glycosyltransferase, partial [Chthoniobacterales bacterium]